MKKISVVIPCYNEEENVGPITKAVSEVFQSQLPGLNDILHISGTVGKSHRHLHRDDIRLRE